MIIEKGADDEVLVLRSLGIQIDIAGLIDDINNNDGQYQLCECSTSRLLEANKSDGINKDVLAQMSKSRSNQPILITAIDKYEWIIDGNHRLFKRAELAKESTRYIPINGVQLDPFVSEFSLR